MTVKEVIMNTKNIGVVQIDGIHLGAMISSTKLLPARILKKDAESFRISDILYITIK